MKNGKVTIGNLLLDLGKLSFGSLILGSILRGVQESFQILLLGAALTVLFVTVGLFIIIKYKEE